MKRLVFAVTVGVIALAIGAAVAGRPTSVNNDLDIEQISITVTTVATATSLAGGGRTTTSVAAPTATSESASMSVDAEASGAARPDTERNAQAVETVAAESAAASLAPTTTRPTTTTTPRTTTTTRPASTRTTLVPDAELQLMVGNASETFGLATKTRGAFVLYGYPEASRSDGVREVAETCIYYRPGFEGEARGVAKVIEFTPACVEPMGDDEVFTKGWQEFHVLLLLGIDWAEVTSLEAFHERYPTTDRPVVPDDELGEL